MAPEAAMKQRREAVLKAYKLRACVIIQSQGNDSVGCF